MSIIFSDHKYRRVGIIIDGQIYLDDDYLRLHDAMAVTGRHLNVLPGVIEFMQELGDPENIDTVVDRIEEVITEVMTTVRAHRTRQAGEEENVPVEADEQPQV